MEKVRERGRESMNIEQRLLGGCLIAAGMLESDRVPGRPRRATPGSPLPRVCALYSPSWLPGDTELVSFPSVPSTSAFPIPLAQESFSSRVETT